MICERVQPVTVTELVEFIHPDKYRLEPGRFDVLCDIFDAWSCDPALAAR